MGPNPMTGTLIKREYVDIETDTYTEMMSCKDKGRGQSDVFTSRVTPKIPRKSPLAWKEIWNRFSFTVLGRNQPRGHPGLLDYRAMK